MLHKRTKILSLFFDEVKKFSITNWWLYIVYAIILAIIFFFEQKKIGFIVLISSGHFIADIFIMMMFTAYSQNSFRLGSYFQIVSMLLFLILKVLSGIVNSHWHYPTSDVIYALSAYKNYQFDIKKKEIKVLTPLLLSILSLFIVMAMIYFDLHSKIKFLRTPWQLIQTIGIFSFGISLSIIKNEKKRYYFSILSLAVMILGSALVIIDSVIKNNNVSGLDISYALLPLTVLIFYIKQIKQYRNIKQIV